MNDYSSQPKLILTIDDDAMMRLLLHDILQQEHFEVMVAGSGAEGLDMLKSRRPDLVLLDVMMPGMNGFECLQIIRAMPDMAMLPIVMLTGADDVDSINQAFKLGASQFIAKPINWPILPHQLRYILRANTTLIDLSKREEELRLAQKIAHLGSWDWTIADNVMQWSEEVFNLLQVDQGRFKGHIQDFYHAFAEKEAETLRQVITHSLQSASPFQLQLPLQHQDGIQHVLIFRGEMVLKGLEVVRVQGTIQDISERQRIEEQVRLLSYYDTLTGLPNRSLFKEVLSQAMSYCDRYQAVISALFISIDRFKRINETLGPNVGDRLLKQFTERLVSLVRDCDFVAMSADYDLSDALVSRLGGNEFTVLLNHIQDTRDSVKVTNRIFQQMAESFQIDTHEIFLGVHIGIVAYPGDGEDQDTIIKNGEFAMSVAREQGQNTYQFFSNSLNVAAFHKLSMENSLCRAIERNELILHYQPKVNMREQRVVGCEALIRWQHPEFGLVPPTQFIPIAEDSGLIIPISQWVVETACQQMQAWQQQGLTDISMAINVSAHQFRQHGFVRQVEDILNQLSLPARCIKLELTESILLHGIEEALITLREFKRMGVQISIDDFGTGYSSLAYLRKLPISELKVDRSFIRDIPHNEEDMAITGAILALAKSLAIEVVAEGVEHEEQAEFLLAHDCAIAQGFKYSKPIAAAEFMAFVNQFNLK
jgi:diguanylate cyclase (GGDEF)-like protein